MNYDPTLLRRYKAHEGPIGALAWSRDDTLFASASHDGRLGVWLLGNQDETPLILEGHTDAIHGLDISPTQSLIVTGSRDRTLRFWTNQGKQWVSSSISAHMATVRSVSFSPNGLSVLSCSDDKSVKLWSVETQKFQQSFRGHSNWVRSTAYSPLGDFIITGGDDRTVKLWDPRTKHCIHTYDDHTGTIMSVASHPSGLAVASTGTDCTINLWDIRTHLLLQHYPGCHGNTVCSLSFHPSGDYLLTSSGDSTLKIWDLKEGHLFYTLYGHNQPTNSAVFSHSGAHFVSGGADSTVLLWETVFDSLLSEDVDMTGERLLSMDLSSSRPTNTQRPLVQPAPNSPPWLADVGGLMTSLDQPIEPIEPQYTTIDPEGGKLDEFSLNNPTIPEQIGGNDWSDKDSRLPKEEIIKEGKKNESRCADTAILLGQMVGLLTNISEQLDTLNDVVVKME
eukprot:Ihof_evm1s251 gene=Ihof_evmTU1s251